MVVPESLYTVNGNDVNDCFRSATNSLNATANFSVRKSTTSPDMTSLATCMQSAVFKGKMPNVRILSSLYHILQSYQCTPVIQPTTFENIDLCLNRACTALATHILKELLHLFMTNKGIIYRNLRWTCCKRQAENCLVCSITCRPL